MVSCLAISAGLVISVSAGKGLTWSFEGVPHLTKAAAAPAKMRMVNFIVSSICVDGRDE